MIQPRALRRSLFPILFLAGCEAGYPPAHLDTQRENDLVARRAAEVEKARLASNVEMSEEAEELEAELFLTDAGKVLARSIHAHGGWDVWLGLQRFSYVRDRIQMDEKGQPATGTQRVETRFSFTIDPDGRITGEPSPEAEQQLLLFGLPFILARAGGRTEYLGVESDARTGDLYERVRWDRGQAEGGGWILGYFDYSTYILRRVLEKQDGQFVLTTFSDWKDLEGFRFATRRSIYHLKNNFEHRDLHRPDEIAVVTELVRDD